MPNKNNEKDKLYLEERKVFIDLLKESTNQLDKNLLYISTGALFLSLNFIEKIVKHPIKDTLIFLVISWFCLIICIILTLISFYSSTKACFNEIENLDKKYLGQEVCEDNFWSNLTSILNPLAILSLITGIIFQVIFICINMYSVV